MWNRVCSVGMHTGEGRSASPLVLAGSLLCLLLAIMASCLFPAFAYAEEAAGVTNDWSVETRHEGVTVNQVIQWKNDAAYLFLPAGVNLSEVKLTNDSQSSYKINGHSFRPGESLTLSNVAVGSSKLLWKLPVKDEGGHALFTLNVYRSENIAGMYLTSDDPINKGRGYVEAIKGNEATGSMVMVNANGSLVYNNALKQIKGRGNSTWTLNKKPYQIKLDKKTDLLETGKEGEANKTWVLLANGYDPTLMNNYLAYQAALSSGLNGSVGCRFVDLWYDGEYRGNYLLCEKVQVGEGRIDIPDMDDANEEANPGVDDLEALPTEIATNKYGMEYSYTPSLSSPADITGGYLFEFDGYYWMEKAWFSASIDGNVYYFTSKNPGAWSKEEAEFLSCQVQEAFNKIAAGEDISDVFDAESYAVAYWIYEFAKNSDAFLNSSTYFYVPGNGDSKIYAGPVWDFDRALGNHAKSRMCSHPSQILVGEEPLAKSINVNAHIQAALEAGYDDIADSYKAMWNDSNPIGFSQTLESIKTSAAMNNILWWDQRWYGRWNTYEEATSYLKNWLPARLAWMESSNRGVNCISLEGAGVKFAKAGYAYTGSAQSPAPVVTLGGKILSKGTDYEVYYSSSKYVGTATVTLVGINGYKDRVTATFDIVPVGAQISRIYAGTSSFQVLWKGLKTSQADGYEIRYSTSKSMTGAVVSKVEGKTASSKTIKGLKSGKRYYVQVRSYKTVNGKTYTSSWSTASSFVTKKASGNASVKSIAAKSKAFKVTWTPSAKASASGFEIRYSTSKSMSGAVTKLVKGKTARSATISKLKGGKTYYVQVRLYKMDGVTKYVSSWSKVVKVTTK